MSELPELSSASSEGTPHVFSVTEITQTVRTILEETLGRVWVEGEVSNYRKQSSGHQYFTLKDGGAQLQCVMFARPGMWKRAPGAIADGMHVRAYGALTVYEARGQYQLNVQMVQAEGAGLLQARFEALKRKLAAEGLFAPERKRPLPALPTHLAIITSPTGAALRDMLHVLTRRSPWVRISVLPARVQGEGAAEEMVQQLENLARWREQKVFCPDAVILARGGGSAEDLWQFNEEVLARAMAACPVPTVSAVGHEIDFTIADFVADLRAPTPSAAAEMVAPDQAELQRRLQDRVARLQRCASTFIKRHQQQLAGLARSGLFREPRLRLDEAAQRLDFAGENWRRGVRSALASLAERVKQAGGELRQHRPDRVLALQRQRLQAIRARFAQSPMHELARKRQALQRLEHQLRLLSPRAVLERGYAIARSKDGRVLRDAAEAPTGTTVQVLLSRGELETQVTKSGPAK